MVQSASRSVAGLNGPVRIWTYCSTTRSTGSTSCCPGGLFRASEQTRSLDAHPLSEGMRIYDEPFSPSNSELEIASYLRHQTHSANGPALSHRPMATASCAASVAPAVPARDRRRAIRSRAKRRKYTVIRLDRKYSSAVQASTFHVRSIAVKENARDTPHNLYLLAKQRAG
jgi:hypothetical protein